MTASSQPARRKARKRFRRRVVLLAMLLLVTGVLVLGSCATTITPPTDVRDGVAILVVDYGRHSSLVLPDFHGGMVEYAYGEHAWFARNQSQWYRVGPVLFLPTAGTLGRWPDRPAGSVADAGGEDAASSGRGSPAAMIAEGDRSAEGWGGIGHDGPAGGPDRAEPMAADRNGIDGPPMVAEPGVGDGAGGRPGESLLPERGADDSVLGWAGGGRVLQLVVERERVIELKAELDEIFGRTESPVFNPLFRMYFADHPRSYWLGFNCNHAVAQWLRQLGCRTRGRPLLSNFRLAEP